MLIIRGAKKGKVRKMSEGLYQVSFSGDIDPKFELPQVKAAIAKMFKANEQQMLAFFSGRQVVIKNKLDLASAKKYYVTLAKVGAICRVESMETGKPVNFAAELNPASTPKPTPTPAPTPTPSQAASAPSTTPKATPTPTPSVEEKPAPLPQAEVEEIEMTATPAEPAEENDEEQTPWSKQVSKASPNWGIGELGESIENLKGDSELLNPDISGISLAELGSTLSEGVEEAEPVVVDISGISLEPVEESNETED